MSSLKNSLAILLSLFPLLLLAGETPSFLVKENAVLDEFRGQYRSKISELSQNYIVHKTPHVITWRSHKGLGCGGRWQAPKTVLASISMATTGRIFRFELKGCNGRTLFVETYEATDSESVSLDNYLSGKIEMDNVIRYELKDESKNRIFELRKMNDLSSFKFLDQKIMEIYKQDKQWQYKALGYEASYSNGGFGFNVSMLFPDQRITINWEQDDVRIFDQDFARVPVNTFLTSYSHAVQNSTLSFVASIMKGFMKSLPSTEFVSSGGQNSRFLDDMRLAYTRLLNNLELNLVKQFIQDLIKYLEDGLLKVTDNRPENK
tara:strand:+ start:1281 stop:2237 length:957 start_codon:yes stop_codon:yes gene_type:complete